MNLPVHYLGLAGVLFLSNTLYAAAGFGFGLLAVPVLLLAGWPPYQAVAISATSVVVHGSFSFWRAPARAADGSFVRPPSRELGWLLAAGVAGQPVGVWLLGRLAGWSQAEMAQVFGGMLLVVLAVKLWWRPRPRPRLHPAWGLGTLFSSGLISGMSGMGGPPIVLWAMAHSWSAERIRVTLWTLFSLLSITNLCWLNWRFGAPVREAIGVGLLVAPVMLLGAVPGNWIARRLSPAQSRHAVTAILLIVALYAISQPILMGAAR